MCLEFLVSVAAQSAFDLSLDELVAEVHGFVRPIREQVCLADLGLSGQDLLFDLSD